MYVCVRACVRGCVCVLYYIVKGILAETLVFGARGEQECWVVYFRWRIHLQTLDYFLSTPVYRKTKLRPQSRVLMKSTKKGAKFSRGGGRGEIFFLKILTLGTFVFQSPALQRSLSLPVYKPTSRFSPLLSSSSSLVKCVSFPVTPLVTLSFPPLHLPLAAAIPGFSGGHSREAWPLPPLPSGPSRPSSALPCHLVSCSPFLRNSQVNFINVGMEPMLKAIQDFVFVLNFAFLPLPPCSHA